MIRALRGMGHQPLFDLFRDEEVAPIGPPTASQVIRYLNSGLPVILTMNKIEHALTAVGYVEVAGPALRDDQTYDAFVKALIVHDDQRGPYKLLPISLADVDGLPRDRLLMNFEETLTVADAVSHMFVPLPLRVYLRADRADTVAHDFLRRQAIELDPNTSAPGRGLRRRGPRQSVFRGGHRGSDRSPNLSDQRRPLSISPRQEHLVGPAQGSVTLAHASSLHIGSRGLMEFSAAQIRPSQTVPGPSLATS